MEEGAPLSRTTAVILGVAAIGAAVLGAVSLTGGGAMNGSTDAAAGAPPVTAATTLATTVTTAASTTVAPTVTTTAPTTTTSTTTTTTTIAFDGWVDPASAGQPWGGAVEGVLTFRGNPTRTFHGAGPMPSSPSVLWRYPSSGGLCSESSVGEETRTWCGTGWTGQPSLWRGDDGRLRVAFGAYDRAVHLLDADTGDRLTAPFVTGDIIKGSVTVDPDGYPLIYTGSRDNFFRILSFDRGELVELWRLSASEVSGTRWNNDWDGSALVIDDVLFEGGENSVFHIVKLNRGFDDEGFVTVDPELIFDAPGYDDELLRSVGDGNVSIESSVAIHANTVYFANSGGLVQGWDISGLLDGETPERTFRFWAGDDIDATVVVDADGFLYVAAEYERGLARAREVGQLFKLDPSRPDDPLVWSVDDSERIDGGLWATPALHRDLVIAPTDGGRLLGVDAATGEIRWTVRLPGPLWSSPTVVDDVLLQGDCDGTLHAFDVSDTTVEPPRLWGVELGGCIESSPAVFGGRIVVGTRSGAVFGIG